MPMLKSVHVVKDASISSNIFIAIHTDKQEADDVAADLRAKGSTLVSVMPYPLIRPAKEQPTEGETTSTINPKKANKPNKAEGVPADGSDDGEPIPKPKTSKPKKSEPAEPMVVSDALHPNSLNGLKVAFCGTLEMGHAKAEATAKIYGATVVRKPKDAHYVVLGKKPGTKTTESIQDCEVATIDQDAFIQMIRDGFPGRKLRRTEIDPIDLGRPAKKQKK